MQCFSNLVPEMYITKETKCCHGNSLDSSLFLSKTKYPHLQDRGSYLEQTLIIRLTEVNGPWLEFSECGHWPY